MDPFPHHKVYIALGSNLGNRAQQILDACSAIEQQIGLIIAASGLYRSAAAGFEGNEFLNACILVHSPYPPATCLNLLQKIERSLGRVASPSPHYQNRPIDLDILLYDDQQIQTRDLVVPHPRMAERNFVLQPLIEIFPHAQDPKTGILYNEMLSTLESLEVVSGVEITLSRKRYPLHQYDFIAIEGNIGCGKTSLTHKLVQDYKAKSVLERFSDNPFLPLFYETPERYAFSLEMSFLADRYQQLSEDTGQHELFTELTISDYYVVKSLIFSKITLDKREYDLYSRLFYLMYNQLTKPDLYIYLHQTEERLLRNIAQRGRSYEQSIDPEYLKSIHSGYTTFLHTQKDLNSLIIPTQELDFVACHKDYVALLQLITDHKKKD